MNIISGSAQYSAPVSLEEPNKSKKPHSSPKVIKVAKQFFAALKSFFHLQDSCGVKTGRIYQQGHYSNDQELWRDIRYKSKDLIDNKFTFQKKLSAGQEGEVSLYRQTVSGKDKDYVIKFIHPEQICDFDRQDLYTLRPTASTIENDQGEALGLFFEKGGKLLRYKALLLWDFDQQEVKYVTSDDYNRDPAVYNKLPVVGTVSRAKEGGLDRLNKTSHPADRAHNTKTFGLKMAHSLHEFHEQASGLAHGDVKADNFLVKGEKVYLCDYGHSRRVDIRGKGGLGSKYFQSPEVRRGNSPTIASDWYSFGMTLYRTYTSDTDISWHKEIEGQDVRLVDKNLIDNQELRKLLFNKDNGLLLVDSEKRASYNEIINHPFFNG